MALFDQLIFFFLSFILLSFFFPIELPFRIVFVTFAPMRNAPENSKIEATMRADFNVSVFEPTDVAKAFATKYKDQN